MSFNRNQIVLFIVVIGVVAYLFTKGYKTPNGSVGQSSSMMSAHTFQMEEYIHERKKELAQPLQERVSLLEAESKSTVGLQNIIVLWDSLNNQLISAHYMEQYAIMEPTEKNWFAAGSKYYAFASMSSDSVMIAEAASKAKMAFEKVMKLNPNNLDAQTAMAAIIVQVDQDVMKGVGLLKDVVAKDSNNVQAIFTLGMLSIQSGQFDKAKERFVKLTTLQPFNPEYYFYLGEVYAKSGDTQNAIKTYETCKTLLKDDAAKKEIESLINKLKNI
jgi:tetratricopeptide (TPR) repeat protein